MNNNTHTVDMFDQLPYEMWDLIFQKSKIKSLIMLSQTNKNFNTNPILIENIGKKLKWNKILKFKKLTESFMRKYHIFLNWKLVTKYQKLSEDFMLEYSDNIYWNIASSKLKITDKIISTIGTDKLSWKSISYNKNISDIILLKYGNLVIWDEVHKNRRLALNKYYYLVSIHPNSLYNVNWKIFSSNSLYLSQNFFVTLLQYGAILNWEHIFNILKFDDKNLRLICQSNFVTKSKSFWFKISHTQNLTENFIFDYLSYLSFDIMSSYQTLSPKILKLLVFLSDFTEWDDIFIYQKINKDLLLYYIQNNIDINWNFVSIHQSLDEDLITLYQNNLIWKYISQYQILSESFIEKHKDKVVWNLICKYQKLSYEILYKWALNPEINNLLEWDTISYYQIFHKSKLESIYTNDSNPLFHRLRIEYIKKYNIDLNL